MMKLRVGIPTLAVLALPWLEFCRGATDGTAPSGQTLIASMSQIPTCALKCIVSAVTEAGCSPTDPECVCVDQYEWIEQKATPCLLSSCDATEGLVTKNITERACNKPIRDNSGLFRYTNIVSAMVSVIIAIRLVFKRFFSVQRKLAPDDWVMLVAFGLGIPSAIVNAKSVSYGLGFDFWTVSPQNLENFVKAFYVMEILYLAVVALVKVSLSLFYLAIFPAKNVRYLLLGTAIFNAVFGFVFVTVAIFQCTPVNYFWKQYLNQEAAGRCINVNLFAWIHAGANIAIDIWMLAVPLSQVKKLQLHWKKKLGVTIMFLLGTFVTVVSVLRLQSLVTFSNSTNPTYDQVKIILWSNIEQNVGAFCTCLPTLRLMLVRYAPRIFGTEASAGRSEVTSQEHDARDGGIHKRVEFTSSTSRKESSIDEDESSDHGFVQKV